jgi:hypothetical protein
MAPFRCAEAYEVFAPESPEIECGQDVLFEQVTDLIPISIFTEHVRVSPR